MTYVGWYQTTDAMTTDANALSLQLAHHLAGAVKRIFEK